jgi:hypothetical protein
LLRHIVINDTSNVFDIETSAYNIGCDQNIVLSVTEVF